MSEQIISYIRKDTKITNIEVNGQKLPDCSLSELTTVITDELQKQEKGN